MEIRHLKVKNFRGIKELEWFLSGKYICLIGPGDSTKTTILDAIEYALYPSYTFSFDDTDFYNCDVNSPIEIYVTISDVPEEFYDDQKFGLYFRGLKDNQLIDEPDDDCIKVLTIKLFVDKNLDPEWTIFVEREKDRRDISNKSREKLGVLRIGSQIDKHFTWSRGSILNKWSESIDQAKSLIATAVRKAKADFNSDEIEDLTNVLEKIKTSSEPYGVKPKGNFKANLDTKSISFGYGAISLSDDNIPVRQMGFGTKKLLALSLQTATTKEGAILLLDEVESGLEPYRLRNLIRILKSQLKDKGQIITTTHSSVTLVEFEAHNLVVVQAKDGIVNCQKVPDEIQNVVRLVPEGLLSHKVIVCEGATEFGFLLAFEDYLISKGKDNFGYLGVSIVDGKGDTFKQVCIGLSKIGYKTAVIIDSDVAQIADTVIGEIEKKGIDVFTWKDRSSIEQRIAEDVPFDRLIELVRLAIQLKIEDGIENAENNILESLKAKVDVSKTCLDDYFLGSVEENKLRKVIGELAKSNDTNKKWFKRIDKGKKLGEFVFSMHVELNGKNLSEVISKIEDWIYDNQ